jgi:nicrotizing toxin Mtb-like protein
MEVFGLSGDCDASATMPLLPTERRLFVCHPRVRLPPGTRLNRFGGPHGRFVSPENVPMPMRALPHDAALSQYRVYEVVQALTMQSGQIAPAFGKIGLGIQHILPKPASELVADGVLRLLHPP